MQCKNSSVLDVSTRSVSFKFLEEISVLAQEISNSPIIDWQKIQNRLKLVVKEQLPWLAELGAEIRQKLDSESGFVAIEGLLFHLCRRPLADHLYLSLAAHLGQFTVHSNSQNVIWDVTPRSCVSNRKLTFSELNSEAPLHIDSAFRSQPEQYFGLFALQSAKQGGDSIIIKSEELIHSLNSSFLGKQCLKILREEFPFEVPPAFVGVNKSNIILAPIVADNPLIRFRLDTIKAGLKSCPDLATVDRLWALEYFNNFLNAYPNKFQFKLDSGNIIFINNHKVLHGRTAFVGSDRLLLRVRIDNHTSNIAGEKELKQEMPVVV